MSETTSMRPNRARLGVLRVAGLLVLMVSLVLPATRAADALNIRQRIDHYQEFDQLSAQVSQVTINAAGTWVEVVRGENPLDAGVVWVQRACVLPSSVVPWSGVSTADESEGEPPNDGHLLVFASSITGWEQALRRCETWVHVYVDPRMAVRVWDGSQVHEVDTDLARWTLSPDGALVEHLLLGNPGG